jgi:hypothetical protein
VTVGILHGKTRALLEADVVRCICFHDHEAAGQVAAQLFLVRQLRCFLRDDQPRNWQAKCSIASSLAVLSRPIKAQRTQTPLKFNINYPFCGLQTLNPYAGTYEGTYYIIPTSFS